MKKILSTLLCLLAFQFATQAQVNVTRIERTAYNDALSSYFDTNLKPFYHGVASGDPMADKVIIWTRITPDSEGSVSVTWKMATDPQMTSVVKSGTISTDETKDYTVKVDVTGLQAAKTYYYQFTALNKNSLVGKTRTAPSGSVSQLRFAVVSCSNYQDGYFNAYQQIAQRNDIDAVIHLGDYIYEYETGGFGYSDEVGRKHQPNHEIVTLSDYRVRYSYYRLDAQLRNLHQQVPFINIWDDHEFANDAYKDGAENHQSNEGSWATRKANAFKAYFEWMPVRVNTSNPNRIYRKISYGNLADLIMLDTRIEGRDKQPGLFGFREQQELQKNIAEWAQNKGKAKDIFEASLQSLLPMVVNTDFEAKASTSEDNYLNKEEFNLVISKMAEWLQYVDIKTGEVTKEIPQEEIDLINTLLTSSAKNFHADNAKASRTMLGAEQLTWFLNNLSNSTAQWKIVGNQVMLMPFKGYPIKDAWDGYEDERETILRHILNNNIKNTIFLTGDIHSTFVGDVPLGSYNKNTGSGSVLVEFVTPSVTSSNIDEFTIVPASWIQWLINLFNPHMKQVDMANHGYYIMTLTPTKTQADWFFVNDVKKPNNGQKNAGSWYVNNNERFLRKASGPLAFGKLYGEPAPATPIPFKADTKEVKDEVKNTLLLIGNYPNPATTETNFHYALSQTSDVKIIIYTMNGEVVKEVLSQKQEAGIYNVNLDLQNLKAGTYIYKVETNNQVFTRRLLIQK